MTLAIVFLAMTAALITGITGLIARKVRSPEAVLGGRWVLIGSAIPAIMVLYGFYRSWPWPSWRPEAMEDMLPAEPWLLIASVPTWILCLVISRAILARK